jgi:hypothetical protein
MEKTKNKTRLARAAMTLLFALLATVGAWAQSVQIGDGTSTNSYLPSNSLYNYSISQQIYTAEEIGASGSITSIAFYNGGNEKSRKYKIYMAHTTKSAFDSTSDWIALTDDDLVYDGAEAEAVAMTAGAWTTFTLDTPFAYNGTDNLVIGVLDLTGTWAGGMSCRVFTTTTNQALYKYQDDGAYGIDGTYNDSQVTGTLLTVKNQIILGGIQQAYPSPTGLTATPHPTSADLSWTENGTAATWQVAYKTSDAEDFTIVTANTNPFTLTGLIGETSYTAKVRAYYSETVQSGWSAEMNFITQAACPTPTALTSSNITTTTTTLSWTIGYEEINWVLQYGTNNSFTEGTYTEVEVSGTPTKDLTGLTEATTYYARVKASCGGDEESAWSSVYSFRTAEACPDGKVCIGTGTATNNYLPANNYYKYSLTQQIYTAEEIGEAGAILSIDFFKASTAAMVKNLDIYIVSTTKDEFTSNTDWIPVTANDLVFSGTVTFADNDWTTIELDNPFVYDGTSNICIVVDNNTGDYVSSTGFRVFTAEKNQTIYQYSDNDNLDPTTSLTTTAYSMTSKNRIRLGIGEPPACAKPTGLAVNYEGGATATVTWNGEAGSYNIDVNGTVTNGVTSPYTLNGLELGTTYQVKVQAVCSESAQSEWTSTVSFTTDLCMPEDMCNITFTLTDSWGDGWGGNAIVVKDVLTQTVIATLTNENLDGISHNDNGETQTIDLPVCNGREIEFSWTAGSYINEVSYTVTDINDEVIVEGSGAGFDTFTYTVNCTVSPCRKPTNLAASEIGPHSAMLSWTEKGEATAWVVAYKKSDDANFTEVNATTNSYTLEGLDAETAYTVKVAPVCEEEKWSNEITFTTAIAAPAPTNLMVSNIGTTSAIVSWTSLSNNNQLRYVAYPNYVFQGYVTNPYAMANGADASWLQGSQSIYGPKVKNGESMLADDFTIYTATSLSEIEVYSYQTGSTTTSTFTGLYAQIYDGNPADGGTAIWGDMDTNIMTSTSFTNCYRGDGDTNGMSRPIMAITARGLDVELEPGTYWLVYSLEGNGSSGPWGVPNAEPNIGNTGEGLQYTDSSWTNLTDSNTGTSYGCAMKLTFEDIETFDWTYVNNIEGEDYNLTNLNPDTPYLVQIRSNYGDEGDSKWVSTLFTTLSAAEILFAKEGYATYYNGEKDVVLPEGMKAHVVTDGSTNLTYAEVADGDTDGNVVPAGTAVLLQVEPSTEAQTLPVYLATPSAAAYAGTNLLFGSDEETETTGGAKYYKLTYSDNNDNFGWYWGADEGAAFISPAHKAWLALPASTDAQFLGLPDWEDTTGIIPVGVDPDNGEWYTLQGLKIGKKPTTAGVYIHNGKKVLIP